MPLLLKLLTNKKVKIMLEYIDYDYMCGEDLDYIDDSLELLGDEIEKEIVF